MPIKECDIVLICVSSEILLGIYEESESAGWKLTNKITQSGKTSEILPLIFSEILQNYHVRNIAYAKGPGNFSAIKLSYVFLKTLSIIKGVRILAQDSFYFTSDRFIHAYGKIHFEKNGSEITPLQMQQKCQAKFTLPEILVLGDFHSQIEPLYVLPAV